MSEAVTMKNLEEFYILGLPIETDIGNLSFLKVKDYPTYHECLNVMRMTKDHVVKMYYDNDVNDEMLEALKQASLYELVMINEDFKVFYLKLLNHLIDEDVTLEDMGIDKFNSTRKLVLDTSVIKEEKINPNPEIQSWIDKSKSHKASMSGKMEFSDIITSVAIGCGYSYEDINEMTLFQLYNNFYRVAQFKNYDTSTLFATVASDKIDITSWSENIDVLKEELNGHTRSEFEKITGGIS